MAAASTDWAEIRQRLLDMVEEDGRVRTELAAEGSLFHRYHPRMRAVHDRNAAALAGIMQHAGWPGEPRVGREGAEAAWLIVQHAIALPAFQRQALAAIRAEAERGEVPRWQVAMLEDRVRTFEGRDQRYGTQLDWDATGRLSPLPVEDPAGVDERRAAVGLPPLAEDVATKRRAAAAEGEKAPVDREARQREFEGWLREVGWRSA